MKRYVIEFGMGMDFHGQNINKAAQKAVKDAVSRSCLCGLSEILGLDLDNDVYITVTLAVSKPEKVDPASVAACLPIGKITVKVVTGGLNVPGLYLSRFGDKDDSIEVAIAVIEVGIKESEK
jgi:uncharacterized protein (TIGR02058 family)